MRRFSVFATLATLALLLFLPGAAHGQGIISSLSVFPDSVRDGASSQGTVALAFPDSSNTQVLVFSSDTSAATVPATVTVPAGATTATFTISTNAAAPPNIVTITAWVGNTPRSANLSVNAATPGGPSLSALSFNPASLTGGSPTTGKVTFNGVTDGAVVQLSSSNPALVQVPFETVVSGGQSSAAFPVTTSPVSTTRSIPVTASWFGVSRTASITLSPGAPAAADKVKITTATWRRGLLTIKATSTNPKAILSVHSRSGSFMFELTNNGGGRYSDQRGWVDNPQQITVRSNLGGSATASTSR